jgi:hypothetical protein
MSTERFGVSAVQPDNTETSRMAGTIGSLISFPADYAAHPARVTRRQREFGNSRLFNSRAFAVFRVLRPSAETTNLRNPFPVSCKPIHWESQRNEHDCINQNKGGQENHQG